MPTGAKYIKSSNVVKIFDPISIEKYGDYCKSFLDSFTFESVEETPARVDLAFLFGSPLVGMYQGASTIKMQPVSSTDYELEFDLVIKNINDIHRSVKYTKAVATIANFQKCLNEGPTILHFAGHGLTNRVFSQNKSKEGDFLVFEDDRGKAHYVSCMELKKILGSLNKQPELVFVSSCHSRLVGEVFRAAGAKHVVCVKRSEQMLTRVAQLFSKNFYTAFFSCNSVCKAYANAIATLESEIIAQGLDPAEANKFELLIGGSGLLHSCAEIGGWADGFAEFVGKIPYYDEIPAQVEHFVGRKIELHSLVSLIAENRLVTVMGLPGIGKTSVIKALARHLLERGNPSDGIIYVSARGLESTDAVIDELYSSSKPKPKEAILSANDKKLPLILSLLAGKEILLVLDNVEDPLNRDRVRLLNLLHCLLTKLPKLRIITTSQLALGPLRDYGEKIYNLFPLDPQSAVLLLEKRVPREIKEEEFSELFEELSSKTPIFSLNPYYDCTEENEAKPHKLMQILSGHPQAISLAAALLNTRNITQLYQELFQSCIYPDEMSSLKASLKLSIGTLNKTSPTTLRLFKLLALFPNGATTNVLKEIWGSDYLYHVSKLQDNSLVVKKVIETAKVNQYWILPFMADYAFDCLKDCDIIKEYERCCNYHIDNFRKAYESGREAFARQLLNEANILACLKRSKYWLSGVIEKEVEEDSNVSMGCSQVFLNYNETELGDIPTDLVVEHLPRDESRLTQSISRSHTSKLLTTPNDSSFRSKSNIRSEEAFNEEINTEERTMKVKSYKKHINNKLNNTVNILLLYYATSLVLDKRYRDAKNIVFELVGEINYVNTIIEAHLAKLIGVVILLIEPDQYLEARDYIRSAETLFEQKGCFIGETACRLVLTDEHLLEPIQTKDNKTDRQSQAIKENQIKGNIEEILQIDINSLSIS